MLPFHSSPHTHERSHSAAIRLLSLCRSHGVMGMEECVRRMSGENARRLGLMERGIVAVGHRADLVLLDIDNPEIVIKSVFVNGVPAVEDGRMTGCLSGRILLEN